MQINVKTEILNYGGTSIVEQPAVEATADTEAVSAVHMTIGSMIIQSLNTPTEADKDLDAESKIERAVISQDVFRAMKPESDGIVNIDVKFISELKKLLNIFYAPLPLMRAFEILNPSVAEVPAAES